jgi:hypothetical protein
MSPEEQSDEATIGRLGCGMDCFAEPVIGRTFALPLARNDDLLQ